MTKIYRLIPFFITMLLFTGGCNKPATSASNSSSPVKPIQRSVSNPIMDNMLKGFSLPGKTFVISDEGKLDVLNYEDYGHFVNLGKVGYKFVLENSGQLKKDIGQGIYPNNNAVRSDENFRVMQAQGLLKDTHWNLLKSPNKQLAFYKWATVGDDPGVKSFFLGAILEESGHILQAIKSYYAAVVHHPKSAGWAADGSFVWYIAPAAMGSIKRLCRDYPELNLDYLDSMFSVVNGGDTNLSNDIIAVHPGRFVKRTFEEKMKALPDLARLKVTEKRGGGKVRLVKYANGHWQMLVDNKPFVVRGITYGPTKIGLGPLIGQHYDMQWMIADENKNGRIDAPYDAWVDKNQNGEQDSDEPAVGDFQLLKDMGVNAIRYYLTNSTSTEYDPKLINKDLLRDMYETYGIRLIAGDFLGAYTVGSGADWEVGTDYTDPKQLAVMKEVVRQKVLDLKDEPFLLMWVLGNENNMGSDDTGVNATRTKADKQPQAYAKFVNEVAAMIHELDPDHPVAIGNLGVGLMEHYNEHAPAIDIMGVNSYPGSGGFGTIWDDVQRTFDRPVLITEYGVDAFDEDLRATNEQAQRDYYYGNLRDIVLNQAGGLYAGNAIGGIIFEYLDEWWKDTHGHPVDEQQTKPQYPSAGFDGHAHEEWFGIAGQGSGNNSPFERRLRKAYFMFQEYWQ